MKRFYLTLIAFCATLTLSFAQKYTEEDHKTIRLALECSDNGNADKAIELYEQLLKKYPHDGSLEYEIAYCYYVKQDYKAAVKIVKKAEADGADGAAYALHGNCLDLMGKRDKAINKYQEGISKFPENGQLYLELGTVLLLENRINEAVGAYNDGIKAEPEFTSNYYRISQLLCQTNEPVWGIVYGEIHELLSPNSKRSEELSKAIYDAYNSNMKYGKDSTYIVSLTAKNTIYIDGVKLIYPFEMLFERYSFRPEDPAIVKEKGHLDMLSLVENRKAFLTRMFEDGQNQEYLYPIFKYQQKVLEAGHWEAYNMWILRKGNTDEFRAWLNSNTDKFIAFTEWFRENKFDPSPTEE